MNEQDKKWIDGATYESLLARWRFAPVGARMFQGETGEYYAMVMAQKRDADPEGHVRASKNIGWER